MIQNTSGKIYYGLHFYPGVAEYSAPGEEPYRVFLNENTLRSMDPTFAGKPIFVEHVEEVESSIDELRKESDGWVIESFFNSADGKHWVKFIVVSEKGEKAVQRGMRLSNAYIPKTFKNGGVWNGVSYVKEIVAGEYEHLAIVDNPRYDESVILSPEQFKKYNEEKEIELTRIANSKDEPKGEKKMALNFFKRAKLENSLDMDNLSVELPKSKKEITLRELVNQMDTIQNMHGYANEDHLVKVGNDEMSVKDLVKKHMDACNEMEKMKSAKSDEGGEPGMDEEMNSEESVDEDMKAVDGRGGDKHLENEDEDKDEMKKEEMKKKNEIKKKVLSLKNAGPKFEAEAPAVLLSTDKLAVGKARYGSN